MAYRKTGTGTLIGPYKNWKTRTLGDPTKTGTRDPKKAGN